MSYIDLIKDRAKVDKKTIVLPESNDKRTLIAAAKILEEKIADIIMIGDEEKIMDGAGWLEVDLTGLKIINPQKTEKLDEYVNLLYETRKAKGMTPEKAREILLSDYLTFGIVMVKNNDADGMVAGACAADIENRTRREISIRFLYHGYPDEEFRRKRYVPVCRLWSEPGPDPGRAGSHCGYFFPQLQVPYRPEARDCHAFPFHQGKRQASAGR